MRNEDWGFLFKDLDSGFGIEDLVLRIEDQQFRIKDKEEFLELLRPAEKNRS